MSKEYTTGINKTGRPPIYSDPKELQKKCTEYFESTNKYTITGLSLYLGFCSRSTLDEYGKKEMFSYIIKRAKLVVEQGYEEMFHNGSNSGIFPLKNMGWDDKTKQVIEGGETPLTTIVSLGNGTKPNETTT